MFSLNFPARLARLLEASTRVRQLAHELLRKPPSFEISRDLDHALDALRVAEESLLATTALSTTEVGHLEGVTRRTVNNWIRDGILPTLGVPAIAGSAGTRKSVGRHRIDAPRYFAQAHPPRRTNKGIGCARRTEES